MDSALCHEWMTTLGGSELVAQRIANTLGITDIFTFTADQSLARELFPKERVMVHSLGATPLGLARWDLLLPVMPIAWRRLDLSGYDVVLTSSHSCVNAIRVRPGALHISYCHTPMRYAWEWRTEIGRVPRPLRAFWPAAAAALRGADRRWGRRVDAFMANSQHVAARIARAYGKPAAVVYPPVDTEFFTPSGNGTRDEFYLAAGRLVPYKRFDIAVRAADAAGVRLVVAGSGPEVGRLRRLAGPAVEFVEGPTREDLRDLYRRARALVFPGIEDFGMALVEAQACGTPVVALGWGGAREAVSDGRTGLLYDDPSPQHLAEVLRRLDPDDYSRDDLRAHAEQFGAARFDARLREVVGEVLERGGGRGPQ